MAHEAAERLLKLSNQDWINPGRDRWLRIAEVEPWQVWLYAIREFWLDQLERALGAGTEQEIEGQVEQYGYMPGQSTAVGRRVWGMMVTEHRSLREVFRLHQLSTGDEIDGFEEPAAWLQDGRIAHVFEAFAYFCGILAARRVRALRDFGDDSRTVLDPVTALRPQTGVASIAPEIDYPRQMFHAIEDPRLVFTEAEEKALGPEWSRVYIYKEYPKIKHHRTGQTRSVKDAKEELMLGEGWSDSSLGPFLPREANPLKCFDTWELEFLSLDARKRIREGLANAHADVIESGPDHDSKVRKASIQKVFDVFATEYQAAGILNEFCLTDTLLKMVYGAAVASGWQTGALEQNGRCTLRFGDYWTPPEVPDMLNKLLDAQIWRHRGKLGMKSCPTGTKDAARMGDAEDTTDAYSEADKRLDRRSPKEVVDAAKRQKKTRSYEKFAAKIGIGKDTLYAITKENRWVSDETYILVAQACDCKPHDLHPRDLPPPQRR
jgi:hypothetical protein